MTSMVNTSRSEIIWITNIRAIACIMVVILHSASPIAGSFTSIYDPSWQLANILDSATRSCVPLFFMITGFLLMRDRGPSLKNVVRVLSALFFYSAIYTAVGVIAGWKTAADIATILWQPAHFHLWFFYSQIMIYGFAFAVSVRSNSFGVMIATLAFMLFSSPLLEWAGKTTPSADHFYTSFEVVHYLGYAILGACLGNIVQDRGKVLPSPFLAALFLGTTALIALMTSIASMQAGKFAGTFYQYNHPLVVISAISLFLLLAQIKIREPLRNALAVIADISLPIYGLHALGLLGLQFFGYRHWASAWIEIPISFLTAITIAAMLAFGLRKIDKKRLVS